MMRRALLACPLDKGGADERSRQGGPQASPSKEDPLINRVLPRSFYARPALQVARALLGQVMVHREQRGRIVEVEAYLGPHDLACHSAKGRTARTEVLFGDPGHAYVYLIYGMHHCFNVSTGRGAAVLIRGLEPLTRIFGRTDGPGRLTRSLGLTRAHDRLSLEGPTLWLERGEDVHPRDVRRGPRVGVDYAGTWAGKPYRLWVANNPFVSGNRTGAEPGKAGGT